MNIIEQLEKFYETELFYLKVALDGEPDLDRNHLCWYSMQRCLGAAELAEMCDADEKTIETLYERTKEKIENLGKNY